MLQLARSIGLVQQERYSESDMPEDLTDDAIDDILDTIASDLARLNKWELSFIASIDDQWERKRHLSASQREVLERIWEKY